MARASHWGTQGKGLGRGTPCAAAMAGERGGASPGRARAASGVRYRLKRLAQKYGGALGVLTETWQGRRCGAGGSAGSPVPEGAADPVEQP